MIVIGISGASGSGKSSIANIIERTISKDRKTVIVSTDNFYKGLPREIDPSEYNFDHPSSVDFDLMFNSIYTLKYDKMVRIPTYDFTIHQPSKKTVCLENIEVLIIEGIYALYDERIRNMMDYKLFIDIDMDVCVLRRLMRDISERGRTVESFMLQYIEQTRPGYLTYILPYRKYADIIIENNKVSQYIHSHQTIENMPTIPIDDLDPQIFQFIDKVKHQPLQ